MDKGTLVEFRVQGDRRLAVVDRPDGKTRWFVVDERGQSHSLTPRQITYSIPGQSYKSSEIPKFLQEVQPYIDPASLEVAWELLVEDGESVNPSQLANLLFSEENPSQCYAAHCLLSDDKLYFKQKGDSYEPRSAAQVAEIKHQQEVAANRAREQEQFFGRIERSLTGEQVEWERYDRQRLEAVERYALTLVEAMRAGMQEVARSSPPAQISTLR